MQDRTRVTATALPEEAVLWRYAERDDCFTDCYVLAVDRAVALADHVAAFYSTRLFKLERLVLRLAFAAPSTDAQARALGRGERAEFAVWTVEDRRPDQLLLCPRDGRTRSWLMVRSGDGGGTLLYFGSAVLPPDRPGGRLSSAFTSGPMLWAHDRYSRALLAAAGRKLRAARD